MLKKVLMVAIAVMLLVAGALAVGNRLGRAVDWLADVSGIGGLRDLAVVVAPGDSAVYLARAQHADGESVVLVDDYNAAIRLDPRNAEAYRGRGEFHQRCLETGRGDWIGHWNLPEPAGDFTRAIELERRPEDYLKRGHCYFYANKFEDAGNDFEIAKVKCSKTMLAEEAARLTVLGRALVDRDAILAVPYFKAAINLDPADVQARDILGDAYLALSTQQRLTAERDDDSNPQTWFGFVSRGKNYAARKQYDLAIKDFSRAIKISSVKKDPEYNPFLLRSLAYQAKGDEILAETDLVKANEQCGPQQLDVWLTTYRRSAGAGHEH
jgi:tetratricopeptide (TPR) repeat protein